MAMYGSNTKEIPEMIDLTKEDENESSTVDLQTGQELEIAIIPFTKEKPPVIDLTETNEATRTVEKGQRPDEPFPKISEAYSFNDLEEESDSSDDDGKVEGKEEACQENTQTRHRQQKNKRSMSPPSPPKMIENPFWKRRRRKVERPLRDFGPNRPKRQNEVQRRN